MTIIQLENAIKYMPLIIHEFTINELYDIVDEVKQYGLDISITSELITAYNNDELKAYCESQI